MTQIPTGTKDRTGYTADQGSTSVDQLRRAGRSLFRNSGRLHALQTAAVSEQSALFGTLKAQVWDEGRAARRSGAHAARVGFR